MLMADVASVQPPLLIMQEFHLACYLITVGICSALLEYRQSSAVHVAPQCSFGREALTYGGLIIDT